MEAGTNHPRRPRDGARMALGVACLLLALAGSAVTARRVLGAAEVVTAAVKTYPATAATPTPGVIGTLAAAPLIVDGRLRVYATTRQIKADLPVDARTQRSPYWSYRRWPEQLVGVVAVRTTVVGRWSDGALIAVDARTGTVAWRADGPVPESPGYGGRRTGAATVYAPDGLFTAGDVVIARGASEASAVRATDGTVLWRRPVAGLECRGEEFTTTAGRYVTVTGCGADKRVDHIDVSTGRPAGGGPVGTATPLGCRVGRSECGGARTEDAAGKTGGWLLDGARPLAAPALAPAGTVLAGDLAITQTSDGAVVARDPVTGREAWRATPGPGRVVAAQPGRVHVLTEDYWLVTLDPGTGVERSRFLFTYGRERLGWTPGHAYADGGFLLVERLAAGAGPADRDGDYYFIAQPVLLAGT